MSDHGHPPPNIKLYLAIFGALMVLTVVTVLVSYWHLPPAAAIGVGLAIASFKAGLVIAFFMHLKGEHKLIWSFLGIMAFTMIGFFLIPLDHVLVSDQSTHTEVAESHHESEGASTHEKAEKAPEPEKAPAKAAKPAKKSKKK